MIALSPHVLIITETWLHPDISDSEITPPGYKTFRKDRDSRGGGVAIMFRESLRVSRLPDISGVECVIVKLFLDDLNMVIGGFYRPPNCDSDFFNKINEFLCLHRNHPCSMLLAGDFNVPSIDWSGDFPIALSSSSEPLVDLVLLHDLSQLVKEPTRVQKDTASILDLFLANNGILRRNPRIEVIEGISDHKIVCLSLHIKPISKQTGKEQLVPMFTRSSDVDVLDMLESSYSLFQSLCDSNEHTIDHLWCFFKDLVLTCIRNYVPFKHIKQRKCNPWMTKEIMRLKRKLKKTRKQHKQHHSPFTAVKLSNMRVMLSDKIKSAKRYYQSVSLKNFLLSSPAKFWRHIAPTKKTIPSLCINEVAVTDKAEIAEALNNYFYSVFTEDDGAAPSVPCCDEIPAISDLNVSEEGVLSLLLNLDVKKSPGIDTIPNAFLVRYSEWCAKYLTPIFNKSLEYAQLPQDWKYAKITPVPKADGNSLLSSYRPISLLCTSAKLLEHIIAKHISVFIEKHHIINVEQHGFRRGLSTTTQLLETVHDLASALDRQNQIDMIFLDFEKAFDRVSHKKLLLKLKPIFKNNRLLAWIEAYLSYRYQVVCIDAVLSSFAAVESGIPQGSVLGPLLFLVFINDISTDIPVKIKLFADDCIIYHAITTSYDQATLNLSLAKLQTWCSTWQMTINTKKTVAMTITRKKEPLTFQYHIGDHYLATVSSFKYLGVIITPDLSWNQHIDYVKNKAMRKLGYLRRTIGKSPPEIKLLAYKTYIRPLLEYAATVWDPYTLTNIAKLENIQRKSVRFIYNCYSWRTSPTCLLQTAELETLQIRRYRERLKFYYLLYHDKTGIDKNRYIQAANARTTRSFHSKKVKDFTCKTNAFKNSFFPRTTRTWNSLDAQTVECATLDAFMNALTSQVLNQL